MDSRKEKGLRLSQTRPPQGDGPLWHVRSQTRAKKSYVVRVDAGVWTCSCPDYEERAAACKHIFCVQFTLARRLLRKGA